MARSIPYGLSVSTFSRGKGASSVAKAAYRAATTLADRRTGEVHNYSRKEHVLHTAILAPQSAAAWTFDRAELWNRVEASERRKDAQVCREVLLTLPRELSRNQQIALVKEFCENEFVAKGMVADFALHSPPAEDDGEQPHAHILLTMRPLDPEGPQGFSKLKAREWNEFFAGEGAFKTAKCGERSGESFVSSTDGLKALRERWATIENRYLAEAGVAACVSAKSLADQKAEAIAAGNIEKAEIVNRPAEPKLRPGEGRKRKAVHSEEVEKKTTRAEEVDEIRALREEIIDFVKERRRIDRIRRIEEARNRQEQIATIEAEAAKADRYKLWLLAKSYRSIIPPDLAPHLAWIRLRPGSGEVVVQLRGGERLRDTGNRISTSDTSPAALQLMIIAAKAHEWKSVDLSGSVEFQARAAEALTRAGIEIRNASPEVAAIIERTRVELQAEGEDPAVLVARLRAVATAEEKIQATRAQADTWIDAAGTWRRFVKVIPGVGPALVRMTNDEARELVQPGWRSACEHLAESEERLTAATEAAGLLRGRKAVAEARAELTEARAVVAKYDRAWTPTLRRRATKKIDDADKSREAAERARASAASSVQATRKRVAALDDLAATLSRMSPEAVPQLHGSDDERLAQLQQQARAFEEARTDQNSQNRHSSMRLR
jgi:hypothetical protein